MSSQDFHPAAVKDHKKRQQLFMLVLVVALIFVIFLRLRIRPTYDDASFTVLYDQLCEELQAGRNAEALLPAARKQVRRAGVNMEVMFYYQYISVLSDTMEPPEQYRVVESPIRDAVNRGDFDDARKRLQQAVFEDESMPAGRADVWLKLIRELDVRWNNDCVVPTSATP